mmetsp:Transcript_36991/g.99714  ORF Transcript_36991/g.99714 Transcript_36991/m.99714 type:complete len:189 (+) Transcript_36991:253-819(+)
MDVAKYRTLPSKLHQLPATGSIADAASHLADAGVELTDLRVAFFDFDQTLTAVDASRTNKSVRGGDDAAAFMQQLKAAGVPSVIVTATKPNSTNCHAIAAELRHLGLENYVNGATVPDAAALKAELASWGANETMAPGLLSLKLSCLLVLNTDRYLGDLPRWAFSPHDDNGDHDPEDERGPLKYRMWI